MSDKRLQFEDKFDGLLSKRLKQKKISVRPGFSGEVVRKLQIMEERRLLAKVVLQERLALAGCIVLTAAVLFIVIAFGSDLVGGMSAVFSSAREFSGYAGTGLVESIKTQWELWVTSIAAIMLAGYGFYNVRVFARQ